MLVYLLVRLQLTGISHFGAACGTRVVDGVGVAVVDGVGVAVVDGVGVAVVDGGWGGWGGF